MVKIIFEAHGTTFDNEAHVASGHNNAALSPKGEGESREMGARYAGVHFAAIFCSDLQRAYRSAEIAFGNKVPIIKDARLRECDYGDLTGHPSDEIDAERAGRINVPFPNGESYEQTNARMQKFLQDLSRDYSGKNVMIIGHRATQYALDTFVLGKSLDQIISTPFKWQPGWTYDLN